MERKSPTRLEHTRLLFLYTKCGRSIVALSGVLLIIIKPPPHDMIRSGTAFVSTASQCNILIDLRVFRESSAMLSVNCVLFIDVILPVLCLLNVRFVLFFPQLTQVYMLSIFSFSARCNVLVHYSSVSLLIVIKLSTVLCAHIMVYGNQMVDHSSMTLSLQLLHGLL